MRRSVTGHSSGTSNSSSRTSTVTVTEARPVSAVDTDAGQRTPSRCSDALSDSCGSVVVVDLGILGDVGTEKLDTVVNDIEAVDTIIINGYDNQLYANGPGSSIDDTFANYTRENLIE